MEQHISETPDEDGEWVQYSDYEYVAKENEWLTNERDELKDTLEDLQREHQRLVDAVRDLYVMT